MRNIQACHYLTASGMPGFNFWAVIYPIHALDWIITQFLCYLPISELMFPSSIVSLVTLAVGWLFAAERKFIAEIIELSPGR